jgi:hypothetical protein
LSDDPDDPGFVAKRWSTCKRCRKPIEPGDRAKTTDDGYCHVGCQTNVDEPTTTPVGVVGSPFVGTVAMSTAGEVLAVMTEDGWRDVQSSGRPSVVELWCGDKGWRRYRWRDDDDDGKAGFV